MYELKSWTKSRVWACNQGKAGHVRGAEEVVWIPKWGDFDDSMELTPWCEWLDLPF